MRSAARVVVRSRVLMYCRLALMTSLASVTGCGAEPDDSTRFSAIRSDIFERSCAFERSCHNAQRQDGGLVLQGQAAYSALVGAPARQAAAAAEGFQLVVPGRPEESFLWIKLNAPLDPRYGELMPWGAPEGLTASELDRIEAWILAGAPEP